MRCRLVRGCDDNCHCRGTTAGDFDEPGNRDDVHVVRIKQLKGNTNLCIQTEIKSFVNRETIEFDHKSINFRP